MSHAVVHKQTLNYKAALVHHFLPGAETYVNTVVEDKVNYLQTGLQRE